MKIKYIAIGLLVVLIFTLAYFAATSKLEPSNDNLFAPNVMHRIADPVPIAVEDPHMRDRMQEVASTINKENNDMKIAGQSLRTTRRWIKPDCLQHEIPDCDDHAIKAGGLTHLHK